MNSVVIQLYAGECMPSDDNGVPLHVALPEFRSFLRNVKTKWPWIQNFFDKRKYPGIF